MEKEQKRINIKALLLLLLIFYQMIKIKAKESLKYKTDLKQTQKLYTILNRWMILEICGKSIGKILKEEGYRTVAVYGIGELGQRLVEKLEMESNLNVIYGIDRNAANISSIVPVYSLEEALKLSTPDVVILTTYSQNDSLINMLRAEFTCPVMKIEELLNETE